MASSGIEIIALIFMALGNILTVICIAIPFWKQNDPQDTFNDFIIRHQGIWVKCQSLPTGNWDCDDFNSFFLGLPTELQAARGLSLTSIFLGILGFIAMIMSLNAVTCGTDDEGIKRRIRLVAGILSALGGLLLVAAVSWYANNIRIQYDIDTRLKATGSFSTQRYIFGASLFVGWVGGSLLMLAGLFGACTGCGGGDTYEDGPRSYAYRASKPTARGEEYV